MIIKKLVLVNIRSYEKQVINFREGITVFSGRTGSGKSTVLIGVEYALFGGMISLTNASLLRRGANKGRVELTFTHRGNDYTVARGLKKVGNRVSVDDKHLSIKKNDRTLPLMARATDITQKILEILGFPEEGNPLELFQVTSYTKQGEIRKIIDMRPEERQQYIDRALQISKYQIAYDNVRDVVNYFEKKKEKLRGRLESLSTLREEVEKHSEELEKMKEEISVARQKLKVVKEAYQRIHFKLEEKKEKALKLREEKQEFDRVMGRLESLEDSINSARKELEQVKEVLEEEEVEPVNRGELESKRARVEARINVLSNDSEQVVRDLKELSERVKGEKHCPLCKQAISEELFRQIKEGYESDMSAINKRVAELKKKRHELEELIKEARKKEARKKRREANKVWLEKTRKKIEEYLEEEKGLEEKKKELEGQVKHYEEFRKRIDELREAEKKHYSEKQSLSQRVSMISLNMESARDRITKKKEELKKLKKEQERASRLRELIKKLHEMRESIRNIREVVRNKFLEDFRFQFQKKFEEIRKSEGTYSVDIKKDYEPVAFADDQETSIESLSGGEKTSVALAYRLALSEIASQASSIERMQVLLLDEPTTGFDAQDVKALPEVLRSIRSIPQIIIVTHEPELKTAADHVFEVKKREGVSKITS